MPELTRGNGHHRYSAGANLSPSTMSYYNGRPIASAGYYPGGNASPSYESYAVAPLDIPQVDPSAGGPVGVGALPSQHRASSGAWSPHDDQTLLAARASGKNWGQIQAAYFPNKTSNACRKRHERLMDRRGTDDFDTYKMERLAKEYMSMRKDIWQGLAARTGEKWSVVEQKVSPTPGGALLAFVLTFCYAVHVQRP
jgi:hypothetical protein